MKVSIVGAAGAIGRATVPELLKGGHEIRVVGRSLQKLRAAFEKEKVEMVAADIASAEGAAAAVEGCDLILYTLGLPYSKKSFAAYPGMMKLMVEAAHEAGARRLIHISNVYPYGKPLTQPVTEQHPRSPCSVKGKWRKEQEDIVMAASARRDLETIVLRFPDFYGPHTGQNSMLHGVFEAALHGKRGDILGPADKPHEFLYVPDAGRLIAALASRDDVWGEEYNFAGAGVTSMRQMAEEVFAAFGQPPKLRVAGPGMVRFLGLFMPIMRELSEMSYLFTDPVILDDSKLVQRLGELPKTSYKSGILATSEFYRRQSRE